jgi:hypothetical protein
LLGAGKHVRWIVFVHCIDLIQEEHVDFIAYGPALVVVLLLTNKAEGLHDIEVGVVGSFIKKAKNPRP